MMSGRIPSRGSDQFNLRFPDGLRDRIAEVAAANGRSMNSEIVARLEASFEPERTTTSVDAAIEEIKTRILAATLKAIEDGSFAKGLGSARMTKEKGSK